MSDGINAAGGAPERDGGDASPEQSAIPSIPSAHTHTHTQSSEIIPLANGVFKRIVTAAPPIDASAAGGPAAASCPRAGQWVSITYKGSYAPKCTHTHAEEHTHTHGPTFEHGEVFDDTALRGNKPVLFTVGSNALLPGINVAVQSMRVGEVADFFLPAHTAFASPGAAGDGAAGLDTDADVVVTIKLISVEDAPNAADAAKGNAASAAPPSMKSSRVVSAGEAASETSTASVDAGSDVDAYTGKHTADTSGTGIESIRKMLEDTETLKVHGNQRLAMDDLMGALYKYKQAQQFLQHIKRLSEELSDAATKAEIHTQGRALDVVMHSNLALVLLKLERHSEALEEATEGLLLEPTHEKLLYRRATARSKLGLASEAVQDLEKLRECYPANKAADALLQSLRGPAPANGAQATEPQEVPAPAPPAASPASSMPSTNASALPAAAGPVRKPRRDDPLALAAKKAFGSGLYADMPNYDKPLQSRASSPSWFWTASGWAVSRTASVLDTVLGMLPVACRCQRGVGMLHSLGASLQGKKHE